MNGYIMRGCAHIGISTEDPDKCAAFYVENLGFHYYSEAELSDGRKIVFVENYGLVLEFVGGKEDNIGAGQVDHICLEVQGIEALAEELKKKGFVPEDAKIGAMPDFFINGAKNLFFTGPAGEKIELFDYT